MRHSVFMPTEVKTFWDIVARMTPKPDGTWLTADGPSVFSFDKGYDPLNDPEFLRVRREGPRHA